MSMNKTCPISNFSSVECSDGMKFYYLKTSFLTSRFQFKTSHARPQPCKRCAPSSRRRSSSDSWLLFCSQFLKTRIVPDLIPDRIESQQRRSNRKAIWYPQQPLEDGNGVIGIAQ